MVEFGKFEKKEEAEQAKKERSTFKPIEIKKTTRQQAIKNCKVEGCNGEPKVVTPFKVVNFCGQKCDHCFLIISYERTKV